MSTLATQLKLALAKQLSDTPLCSIAFRQLNDLKANRIRLKGIDLHRAKIAMRRHLFPDALEMLKEELRLHPDNEEAARLFQSVEKRLATNEQPSSQTEGPAALTEIKPYTMLGEKRLLALFYQARAICEDDRPGNFAECGVAAGGSTALLAWVVARYSKRHRTVYAFDTFEGLPPPKDQDTHAGKHADVLGWGEGTCAAPEASLKTIAQSLGVEHIINPVKGLFCETLPLHAKQVGPLALLHLDGDWYESTMDILNNLYDHVLPGGYLQIDDYGYWAGCRKAVEDFQVERNLSFGVQDIDGCGAFILKP